MLRSLICAFALHSAFVSAAPEPELLPVDEAYQLEVFAPDSQHVNLKFTIADGYYLYRERLKVDLVDPTGVALGPLQMADGEKIHDEFFGDVQTYHHAWEINAPLQWASVVANEIRLKVRYQGCADAHICYPPQTKVFTLTIPAATTSVVSNGALSAASADPLHLSTGQNTVTAAADVALPEDQAFKFETMAGDAGTIVARWTMAPGYYLYRDKTSFSLSDDAGTQLGTAKWPPARSHYDEHFGDVAVYYDQVEASVPLARAVGPAATVAITAQYQGCKEAGICYPMMTRTAQVLLPAAEHAFSVASATPAQNAPAVSSSPARTQAPNNGVIGVLPAIFFAFLGGIILNLMPCVFPVLALKVLGVMQSGVSQRAAKNHANWYTLGVLVSFAVLGLLVVSLVNSGHALGWGFQLQTPWFVAALIFVLFAMGLSLSGVATFGTSLQNVGAKLTEGDGTRSAFFGGVLACVVASPCTGPFMGVALGAAFTVPWYQSLLIFLSLGLGLALPFLLLGHIPALRRYMPKPGAWMETLKQFLAFPLYATAVWLLWVLGQQLSMDAVGLVLLGIVVLALGLWWRERMLFADASAWKKWTAAALALLAVAYPLMRLQANNAAEFRLGKSSQSADSAWVNFSQQALDDLRREGKPVLVDMTAAWCATCKVNEKIALSSQAFFAKVKETGVVLMRGDWTNEDPEISAYLKSFRSPGVPLYVVYPKGTGAPPRVLPQVLTPAIVREALEAAAQPL
jgi:thiol:disulfide interchange protein